MAPDVAMRYGSLHHRSQSAPQTRAPAIDASQSSLKRSFDDDDMSPDQSDTSRQPLRLKAMRPGAVADAIARDPRLIIPVGTCEQHGPHLPLGCDTIIVEYLADDLSAEFGLLRAPTVEYGVNAEVERIVPGNATLRRKTLLRALNDLTDAWEAGGIREFIFLTAQGHEGHQEALATVVTKDARVRVVDILSIELSDLMVSDCGPMHGDEVDTSLLLYLAPHLVLMELAQDYMITNRKAQRYGRGSLRIPSSSPGNVGCPTRASAATGATIYARIRARIRERILLTPSPST